MKLFLNAASPYARLVRVILVETGLQAQTELHYVDPWESPPDLLARNPAAKVSALDLDDSTQLIESGYICDYLIRHSDREDFWPASATDAADRLQVLGLGRVTIDCALDTSAEAPTAIKFSASIDFPSRVPPASQPLSFGISVVGAK